MRIPPPKKLPAAASPLITGSAVQVHRRARDDARGVKRPSAVHFEADVLRPNRLEYPRPQFVRQNWVDLNGSWEFAFGDDRPGADPAWHQGASLGMTINVPYVYQSELSGINSKELHDRVYYARNIEFDPKDPLFADKGAILHFGAVDYEAEVFLNGEKVGQHKGGNTPFDLDLTGKLRAGSNRLVVKVDDTNAPDQPIGKQSSRPDKHGERYDCFYWRSAGIWQRVWLEPVPKTRIEHFKVTTSAEKGSIDLEFDLAGKLPIGAHLECEVSEGPKVIARQTIAVDAGGAPKLSFNIANAKLWSPSSPNLYDLRLKLVDRDGKLLDEVGSYAGIRTVEIKGEQIHLNGKRWFQNLALDQGWWKEGLLTAPSGSALRADVLLAKRAGFNGVRKHEKLEDPRWLYWADRFGLSVWSEMSRPQEFSTKGAAGLVDEVVEGIARDYNHPSIVAYGLWNESWGVPGIMDSREQYDAVASATQRVKALDPTRFVIDNDGWEQTDAGDVHATHDYGRDPDQLRERYRSFRETGTPPAVTWTGRAAYSRLAEHGVHAKKPMLITEWGGFLPATGDQSGLAYGQRSSQQDYLFQYRTVGKALAEQNSAGLTFTQLTDVEQEQNGLVTYDRKAQQIPLRPLRDLNRRLFPEYPDETRTFVDRLRDARTQAKKPNSGT